MYLLKYLTYEFYIQFEVKKKKKKNKEKKTG